MKGLDKYESHPTRSISQFWEWVYCVEYYVIGTQSGQYVVVAHYQDDVREDWIKDEGNLSEIEDGNERLAFDKFEWHGHDKSPVNAIQQCMDKIAAYYFDELNASSAE